MDRYHSLKKIAGIVVGDAILALGVAAFIIPHGFISGGVAGVALVIQHLTGLSVDIGVAVADVGLFLLGALVMGKAFAATILMSTILYPTFFALFSRIPFLTSLTTDPLMAAIYGGVLSGVGIGLVIKVGGSTGGMDIPPIILNKMFGWSVPVLIYICDTCLLLMQFPYSTGDQVLYGITMVLVTSLVMDKVLLVGKKQTQVLIISAKYEEINRMIHAELDRGSTLLDSVTGHLKERQQAVLTVISHRQLPELNRRIQTIDPNAFVVVNEVNEVHGRGFTMNKQNLEPRYTVSEETNA